MQYSAYFQFHAHDTNSNLINLAYNTRNNEINYMLRHFNNFCNLICLAYINCFTFVVDDQQLPTAPDIVLLF